MAEEAVSKCCATCKRILSLNQFSPLRRSRDGLKPRCKECCATAERERRRGSAGDRIRFLDNHRRAQNVERRKEIERRADLRRRAKEGFHEQFRDKATKLLESAYKASDPSRICIACGCSYCNLFGRQSFQRTCSPACGNELSRWRNWRKTSKRRATLRNARVEHVDVFSVFERDGWRCHLCGRNTPRKLRGTTDPRAPELDHIVPLAKGGEHSYRNTACACRACNGAKSDHVLGQMRLFG